MYLLDHNHPTELLHERQEVLMREARDARLAREPRAARPKDKARSRRGRGSSFGSSFGERSPCGGAPASRSSGRRGSRTEREEIKWRR
jgi:hypothetical protein